MIYSCLKRCCWRFALLTFLIPMVTVPLGAHELTPSKATNIESTLPRKTSCFVSDIDFQYQLQSAIDISPKPVASTEHFVIRKRLEVIHRHLLDRFNAVALFHREQALENLCYLATSGRELLVTMSSSETLHRWLQSTGYETGGLRSLIAGRIQTYAWEVAKPIHGQPPRPVLPPRSATQTTSESMLSLHRLPSEGKLIRMPENLTGLELTFELRECRAAWLKRATQDRSTENEFALSAALLSPECDLGRQPPEIFLDVALQHYHSMRDQLAATLSDLLQVSSWTNQLSNSLNSLQNRAVNQIVGIGEYVWGQEQILLPYFEKPHLIACQCGDGFTVFMDIDQARAWGLIVPSHPEHQDLEQAPSSLAAQSASLIVPMMSLESMWPGFEKFAARAESDLRAIASTIVGWYHRFETVRTAAVWVRLAR